ncbi:MAG TPA: CoA-transferase [Solirubrobacteraceae bacterium]|jgi:glutaconate CoA-transferase subunit A|nr:CoA-transferase [Solirubrobacteraceae bacterium]
MAAAVTRDRRSTLADAAGLVADGATIGFGGGLGLQRRPVSFARELIRQGRRGLRVFGVINGVETDLLIGAGAVTSTDTSYVGLDEVGQGPNFQAAAGDGRIEVHEYSEWVITARFRAANMGLPYMPWPSGRFTDATRALGYKNVRCPYTGVELLAVPAVQLDVAVIQAVRCDSAGNAELAVPLDHMYDVDALVARSAKTVIVCAEEIGEVDPTRVQLLGREVDAVVEAPTGSWPAAMTPLYSADRRHLIEEYVPAARNGEFSAYLDRFVHGEAR